MITLIKLDKSVYERINALVKDGKFSSIESFVELAIRNQLLLESEEGTMILKDTSSKEPPRDDGSSLSLPSRQPKTVMAQPMDKTISEAPLWGQVNRLAPTKFVLRMLANILASSTEDTIDLKRFSAEIAEKATEFRLFAKKKDKMDRVRGEFLYIAFPKKDPFSQQRFLNYYVGKGPLKKWTDSVLTGLSFAKIEEAQDGSTIIGLTELGLKFAQLSSPSIDEFFLKGKQIEAPLSKDEAHFLTDNIRLVRPGEFEFQMATLISIRKGADTPTKLKDRLSEFLKGKELQMQLSEKVVNTMQVGVIGRLVEMGLIRIKKEAQKSKYALTERGEELIGKL
jgi:predicted transcriptional regulator/Arc/MetJ-type ribon-helix-helix transcriptional regulator